MTLLIHCQKLSKSFGSRELFNDLSMSIFSGDRIGLIGPNGTGKSTLLKILTGIEKADTGEIAMNRGLKIGYVPQTCLFPDITAQKVFFLLKEMRIRSFNSKNSLRVGMIHLDDLISGIVQKITVMADE